MFRAKICWKNGTFVFLFLNNDIKTVQKYCVFLNKDPKM